MRFMTGFRNSRRAWLQAISTVLLCCWMSGCAKRVVYVNDARKLIQLKAGEAAPRDGVLVSPGYLAEMYERLGTVKD